MGYPALGVANSFLDLAKRDKKKITPLAIQKLVYIAHGWYLAVEDEELVDDEFAEAWQYGPVFPSLYHEFSEFGRDPITRKAQDSCYNPIQEKWEYWVAQGPTKGSDYDFICEVWELYKNYSPVELSSLTHEEGSPWSQTADRGQVKNANIKTDVIKNYYKNLLRR